MSGKSEDTGSEEKADRKPKVLPIRVVVCLLDRILNANISINKISFTCFNNITQYQSVEQIHPRTINKPVTDVAVVRETRRAFRDV